MVLENPKRLAIYENQFIDECVKTINLCNDVSDLTNGYEELLTCYYINKNISNELMCELIKRITYKFKELTNRMTKENIDSIQNSLYNIALHYEQLGDNYNIIGEFMKEI